MSNSEFTNERYVDSITMQIPKEHRDYIDWVEAQVIEELQAGLAEGRITEANIRDHVLIFETNLRKNHPKGAQS